MIGLVVMEIIMLEFLPLVLMETIALHPLS